MPRFDRPIMVHLCKDRTLSYRQKHEPTFNGAALPVMSVNTEEEAQDLLVLVGTAVHAVHPLLPDGRPWYKLFNGVAGHSPTLQIGDLDEGAAYLEKAYEAMLARRAEAAR